MRSPLHGDGTFATRHKFEALRERLLTEGRGVEAVITALAYLRRKHPRIKKVKTTLAYVEARGLHERQRPRRSGVQDARPSASS